LMSLCEGCLLAQVKELKHPGKVYSELMNLIVRLAQHGLIHCDFNEFNIMINDNEEITLIDFPQMVSTSHTNAEMYFDRDVQCIRTFFSKKLAFEAESWPKFKVDVERTVNLDVEVSASGFTPQDQQQLEQYNSENPSATRDNEQSNTSSDEEEEKGTDNEEGNEEEPNEQNPQENTKGNTNNEKQENDNQTNLTGHVETPSVDENRENADKEELEEDEGEGVIDEEHIRKRVAKDVSKRSKLKLKRNIAKSRTKKEHSEIIKSFT